MCKKFWRVVIDFIGVLDFLVLLCELWIFNCINLVFLIMLSNICLFSNLFVWKGIGLIVVWIYVVNS